MLLGQALKIVMCYLYILSEGGGEGGERHNYIKASGNVFLVSRQPVGMCLDMVGCGSVIF